MSCCDPTEIQQDIPVRREHIYDIYPHVRQILRQMQLDSWMPDYIVGITRGGLTPAVLISQYLNCPMHTLNVSLRDLSGCESNLWMAEDAYGYVPKIEGETQRESTSDPANRKKILLVDDINDSGATINWIKQDWQAGCLPNDPTWAEVWDSNVRFAVLVDNQSSDNEVAVRYRGAVIDKSIDPTWIVFPWEEWYNQ